MRIFLGVAAAAVMASPAYAGSGEAYGGVRGGLDLNDGFGVGGVLGADFGLSDKAFAGLAIGLDDSPAEDCVSNAFVVGDTVCVAAGRDINLEARIGIKSGGSKFYAIAGYSNLALKPSVSFDGVNVSVGSVKVDGFKVGAGFEYPLSSKIFTRIEYRYGNYAKGVATHSFAPTIGLRF